MKLKLLALCAGLLCTATLFAQNGKKGSPIVLVHGAWLDASSWDKVVPTLKAAGHEVIVVNLPGHGKDNTPVQALTLQAYTDAVKKAIGNRKNVILVGHSMGGIVVSAAAEQIPDKIKEIVYVGAFLPQNGESLLQLSSLPDNKESLLGKNLKVDEKNGVSSIVKEGIRETFAADVTDDVLKHYILNQKPDALAPFVTPPSLTAENFGKITKVYVRTANDKAIAPDLQTKMAERGNVVRMYTIPTSHVPFLSMPGVISAILLQESKNDETPANRNMPSTSHAENRGSILSSPSDLIDALHFAFGKHPSRAVHAKGIILEGTFIPSGYGAKITRAPHFQKESSNVVIRFSDFTGIPDIPDNEAVANPRGLAVKFIMKDGLSTDIIAHSFNGFPTSGTDQFRELLNAIGASANSPEKPSALDKFLQSHPVAKIFLTTQKMPASYATIDYFGVNTFLFVDANGKKTPVRYQFISEQGEELLAPAEIKTADKDYLIKEIQTRIQKQPFSFKLYAQIAKPTDDTNDPSVAWPMDRERVFLGTIEIQKLAANTMASDKSLSFNPGRLPAGIETGDEMLDFRAEAYPISLKERQ